jgi:hypothetical protein
VLSTRAWTAPQALTAFSIATGTASAVLAMHPATTPQALLNNHEHFCMMRAAERLASLPGNQAGPKLICVVPHETEPSCQQYTHARLWSNALGPCSRIGSTACCQVLKGGVGGRRPCMLPLAGVCGLMSLSRSQAHRSSQLVAALHTLPFCTARTTRSS